MKNLACVNVVVRIVFLNFLGSFDGRLCRTKFMKVAGCVAEMDVVANRQESWYSGPGMFSIRTKNMILGSVQRSHR